MRIAVGWRALAPLDHTATVAQGERPPQPGRDHPGAATQVQHLAGRPTQRHRQQTHRLPQPGGQHTSLAATLLVATNVSMRGAAGAGFGVHADGAVAAHDRAGQGRVARQSPHRLRRQHPTPLTHPTNTPTTDGRGGGQQAGQLYRHRQPRTRPTMLGQPASLQSLTGQLAQRVGASLGPRPIVVGPGGPRQRQQCRLQPLPGLGVQQTLDAEHAVHPAGQPQPAAFQPRPATLFRALGVDDLAQMTGQPPHPRWVQRPGRVHQHRLRLRDRRRWQIPGGLGHRGRVLV